MAGPSSLSYRSRNIQELPDELLRHISGYAGARSSRSLATTNRLMSSMFSERAMDEFSTNVAKNRYMESIEILYYIVYDLFEHINGSVLGDEPNRLFRLIIERLHLPFYIVDNFNVVFDFEDEKISKSRIVSKEKPVREFMHRIDSFEFSSKNTEFIRDFFKNKTDYDFIKNNAIVFRDLKKIYDETPPNHVFRAIFNTYMRFISNILHFKRDSRNRKDTILAYKEICIDTFRYAFNYIYQLMKYEDPNIKYIENETYDTLSSYFDVCIKDTRETYRIYRTKIVDLINRTRELIVLSYNINKGGISDTVPRSYLSSYFNIRRRRSPSRRKSPKKKRSTRKSPKKPKKSIKKKRSAKKTSRK